MSLHLYYLFFKFGTYSFRFVKRIPNRIGCAKALCNPIKFDTPDQIIIVHTMSVMDDLNRIVLREKVVAQGHEHSLPLLEEPLQGIN